MSGRGYPRDESVRRGETLNGLKDRQHALNMQLLLAMEHHDGAAQAELERRLEELADQIRCLGQRGSGRLRE